MVAEMFENSSGSLSFAVIEHHEAFKKGLDPEIDEVTSIDSSIETIQECSQVDQLGAMLEKIGIGDFSDGQRAWCGIRH